MILYMYQMDAHASSVMARLQEKNKEYKEECALMEKELANIEEEKTLILGNMADTLAAGSDAEMAVRGRRRRREDEGPVCSPACYFTGCVRVCVRVCVCISVCYFTY